MGCCDCLRGRRKGLFFLSFCALGECVNGDDVEDADEAEGADEEGQELGGLGEGCAVCYGAGVVPDDGKFDHDDHVDHPDQVTPAAEGEDVAESVMWYAVSMCSNRSAIARVLTLARSAQ